MSNEKAPNGDGSELSAVLGAVEKLLDAANGTNLPSVVRVALRNLEDAVKSAGWQPIETAPMASEETYLFHATDHMGVQAGSLLAPCEDGGYIAFLDSSESFHEVDAWMPLPEPPNSEISSASGKAGKSAGV